MALIVALMALPAADDDNCGQFTMHHVVDTHVRGKALSVVYTNDPVSMERSIQTMEQFLAEDKYRVVGFDLEFINNSDYSFATVDTTNDLKVLKVSGLKCPNLVNIQHHYKVWGSDNNKLNSLVDLASAIIDPYYVKMKEESKKDKNAWHSVWYERLDEEHVKYAAKDAYTSYEMYRRIVDMRNCLLPAPDEGPSHIAAAGASQEVDD
ncbi:hypothetical protein VPH35_077289 [Triticum aestivum]